MCTALLDHTKKLHSILRQPSLSQEGGACPRPSNARADENTITDSTTPTTTAVSALIGARLRATASDNLYLASLLDLGSEGGEEGPHLEAARSETEAALTHPDRSSSSGVAGEDGASSLARLTLPQWLERHPRLLFTHTHGVTTQSFGRDPLLAVAHAMLLYHILVTMHGTRCEKLCLCVCVRVHVHLRAVRV